MGKHDMKVWFDEKQETMPLQRLEHPANVSARAYLEFYALSWQEVARAARLP